MSLFIVNHAIYSEAITDKRSNNDGKLFLFFVPLKLIFMGDWIYLGLFFIELYRLKNFPFAPPFRISSHILHKKSKTAIKIVGTITSVVSIDLNLCCFGGSMGHYSIKILLFLLLILWHKFLLCLNI